MSAGWSLALCGAGGTAAWAHSRVRAGLGSAPSARLPWLIGPLAALACGSIEWWIAPMQAVVWAPVIGFLAIAFVTDAYDHRVYAPLSYVALLYATVAAVVISGDFWRLIPVLVYGIVAVTIVLLATNIGGEDAIGVALLAAMFGWGAWIPVIIAMWVTGIIMPLYWRSEGVPMFVGILIAVFIAQSGLVKYVEGLFV